MHRVASAPERTFDVVLNPPAVAMAWLGRHRDHTAVAVPGVALDAGEMLVAIELATVCGSDVHTTEGRRDAPTPLVLGHEAVGRIVTMNGDSRAVDGTPLRPGSRVVWSIMASCAACDRCMRGLPQKCRSLKKYGHERMADHWELSGGFATHAHLRAGTAVVAVDDAIPARVLAPASCGTATAWAAVDAAERTVELDDAVVLITGAGLIGLTAAALATDRGARVIVADLDASRTKLARRFGAVDVIDTRDADALPRALSSLGADRVDAVIEASGSPRAVESALDVVGVGGVIVLVGSVFPTPPVALSPEAVVRGLLTIRGVHNYTPTDLTAAVRFLSTRAHVYPFTELVGTTFPLAEIDAALDAARAATAIRVTIDPR